MSDFFQQAFEALLRGESTDLNAFLRPIATDVVIDGTIAKVHGYMLRFGPTATPRVGDLARELAFRIVDFAIPRREIQRARELDASTNSTVAFTKLFLKARSLFVNVETTGEPGELLLYVMAQAYLGMPQLFCKMPHKTNPAVHYHGADGIYARLRDDDSRLTICFGQSKLHAGSTAAIKGCLNDIKPFLCDEGGSTGVQERDLQLLRDNLDLGDEKLEMAVLNYLNPSHTEFLKLQYRGICLAGFDVRKYAPDNPGTEAAAHVALTNKMPGWVGKLVQLIAERSPLESKELDVFLLPLPSVQALRDAFLKEIGHVG